MAKRTAEKKANSMPDFKPLSYFIPLHPRVLKNSRMLVTRPTANGGHRAMSLPSKAAREFMAAAGKCIRAIGVPSAPISAPVSLRLVFYGPWGPDDRIPDLSNLYQAVEDLLEEQGVLENDTQVSSHAGSCRVRLCGHCPDRQVFKVGERKGDFKPDCGHKKQCPHLGILAEIRPYHDNGVEAELAAGRFAQRRGSLQI